MEFSIEHAHSVELAAAIAHIPTLVAAQVRFPLPLGHTALVELPEGCSSFRWVLLMSTLPHMADLGQATYRNAVRSAFARGLELADAGPGWLVRGYNLSDQALNVRLKPLLAYEHAERATLAEAGYECLTLGPDGELTFQAGPHEIVTVRFR